MGKQTAANVIFISHISVKSCAYGITTILPFDSHYAIFHLCEFLLVPKWAYLEDPLYIPFSWNPSNHFLPKFCCITA